MKIELEEQLEFQGTISNVTVIEDGITEFVTYSTTNECEDELVKNETIYTLEAAKTALEVPIEALKDTQVHIVYIISKLISMRIILINQYIQINSILI